MNDILFSKNMIDFYNVFRDEVSSAKECEERFKMAVPKVADELNLGRLEIGLNAPSSAYDMKGINENEVTYLYEDGYDSDGLTYKYSTGEHGVAVIKLYPRPNYVWDDDEKEALSTFAFNIFILGGRARLTEMMKKALIKDSTTGLDNVNGFMKYASEVSYKIGLEKYHGIRFNIKNFGMMVKALPKIRNNDVLRYYGNKIKDFLKDRGRVARLGGDNFVALVRDEIVEEFIEFMTDVPIRMDNLKEIRFCARMGIYDIQPKDNIGDVMNYVDVALAAVKVHGKDIVRYEDYMLKDRIRDKTVSANFTNAIRNNELEVFFQPKVDINHSSIYGCEALARWFKDGKLISPMEFVPVLEEEGTICDLDFYIFEKTCEYIHKWINMDCCPSNVSVNFSRQHLKNDNTADRIFELIDKYDIPPHVIEIELTEMSGYDNFENLEKFMNRMKDKGVRTSIDDFGTGYSSLNLLTDLDVDVVKLDKCLSECFDNNDSKTKILLHNVVRMVHELGYNVIAEGVETREQLEFLKMIGCSMVQGYLFDRPLPVAEFEERLKRDFSYNN